MKVQIVLQSRQFLRLSNAFKCSVSEARGKRTLINRTAPNIQREKREAFPPVSDQTSPKSSETTGQHFPLFQTKKDRNGVIPKTFENLDGDQGGRSRGRGFWALAYEKRDAKEDSYHLRVFWWSKFLQLSQKWFLLAHSSALTRVGFHLQPQRQ